MPSDRLIVGLDIGTTKVCAVVGEVTDSGSLDIIGIGTAKSQGLRRGVVINIEATMKSVSEAVEAAEMMSGREVSSVFAGIAGAHIEGINSRGVVAVTGRGREIAQEDIERVLEAARAVVMPMDREILHVLPQEFVVDDQGGIKNPKDMIGIRLEAEVHIITGAVTSAQNLLKCVHRGGLKVEEMVLESIGSSMSVLSPDEKELGVLLIDLGGGTTDVIVHLDGAPYHTDVVAVGGSQVTNDLSIVLKTPIEVAEKIKVNYGCCYQSLVAPDEEVTIPGVGGWPSASIPRKEIARIIEPRMAEIFNLVKEQLLRKDYLKLLGGGVVITGGGSLLPGTVELAQDIFGIPARIGLPGNVGGLQDACKSPVYATAVGLVLYGYREVCKEGPVSAPIKRNDGFLSKLKDWMKELL